MKRRFGILAAFSFTAGSLFGQGQAQVVSVNAKEPGAYGFLVASHLKTSHIQKYDDGNSHLLSQLAHNG